MPQALCRADLKPELNSHLNPPVSEGPHVLPWILVTELMLWSICGEPWGGKDHPIVWKLQTKESDSLWSICQMITSTTHKPQCVGNYSSELGTVVHLKVKSSKESLWLSSLKMPRFTQTDVSEPLGWGSGEAATTEKFFMSDACGWKWNPALCAQGLRSELLAWKRGCVGRTVVLPMLKLASGIFSICTWCWAGVHEIHRKECFRVKWWKR